MHNHPCRNPPILEQSTVERDKALRGEKKIKYSFLSHVSNGYFCYGSSATTKTLENCTKQQTKPCLRQETAF